MWELKNPQYSNQIRVNRGLYYHHGIYESDDRVYHFASEKDAEISAENARVIVTSLSDFLKGGLVEVRIYSDEELKNIKAPDEIIEYAKAHLGEAGYDLINNNCEHFSNRCAFGVSKSSQVDNILEMFARMFG